MIQIDDAGSGSLVGETCIGLYYDKEIFFYLILYHWSSIPPIILRKKYIKNL
jgi:hypothetical protein